MSSGRAAHTRSRRDDEVFALRGQLVPFPQSRSLGPLKWRTVRLASYAILALIVIGAFVEFMFGDYLRETNAPRPGTVRTGSS